MAEENKYPRVQDNYKHKIQVKLNWYNKHGESLVGEEKLDFLTLHDLQDIFDVFIDNVQLNFWHVKTRHARRLQRITNHHIEIKKYIYFVEQQVHV